MSTVQHPLIINNQPNLSIYYTDYNNPTDNEQMTQECKINEKRDTLLVGGSTTKFVDRRQVIANKGISKYHTAAITGAF